MEEEILTVDQDYQKGFNHGYVFAEHQPQFAKMLTQSNVPQSEYFSGVRAGRDRFGFEKMKEIMKGLPEHGKGPEKSKDMDIDI